MMLLHPRAIIMDESSLIDLVINSSPLAGFAAYLVFQTKGMQKRFDQLNIKSEAREDGLRSRYDKVILDLQQEKQTLQLERQKAVQILTRKIESVDKQIVELEKKVDRVINGVDNMSQIVQELRLKDIARDVKP